MKRQTSTPRPAHQSADAPACQGWRSLSACSAVPSEARPGTIFRKTSLGPFIRSPFYPSFSHFTSRTAASNRCPSATCKMRDKKMRKFQFCPRNSTLFHSIPLYSTLVLSGTLWYSQLAPCSTHQPISMTPNIKLTAPSHAEAWWFSPALAGIGILQSHGKSAVRLRSLHGFVRPRVSSGPQG